MFLLQAEGHPFSSTWFIVGFAAVIIVMLAIDLFATGSKSHKISNKEALFWSIAWIGVAVIFGGFVYYYMGARKASEYYTAFLMEKALSIDNLFVFILIFNFFKVPDKYQHKVLFWGVLGAIVLRALFIFAGVWLINLTFLPEVNVGGITVRLNVILTIFGAFLVYAGIKSVSNDDDEEKDFSKNLGVRLVRRFVPVMKDYHGDRFFIRRFGKLFATPLLLVVAVVEMTDLLFAVDSIPAIFSISDDPFILYTSNIFAILGLRTLYFLLANFMSYFTYLKYGLAIILTFIGLKMIGSAVEVIEHFFKQNPWVSLTIVAGILLISVLASLVFKPKSIREAESPSEQEPDSSL